jgi:type IV pilus biogenesis protein CpaD/CtpE
MIHKFSFTVFVLAAVLTAGCARQSTPSMMNTSMPRVSHETNMEQMPVADVSKGYLYRIAGNYERYGTEKLHLSLAYDPNSKTYNAMKAFKDLAGYKEDLKSMGIHSVQAETVKVEGIEPTLMVSYDMARALAPAGCRNMPGLDNGLTTEKIADYRFGCSLDTMLANQIYRPTDLYGRGDSDPGDGRRSANNVEYYRQVEQEEAEGEIIRIQRTDIQE